MYLQRPDETSGGSRFLLALSLSTVTAFAVAAPLAFKAITVDSDLGGQDADVSEVTESPTTTVPPPSGPQIGPKVRSPQAKLPIHPGLPSDYPDEPAIDQSTTFSPTTTPPTAADTVASTTTAAPPDSSSTTETTVGPISSTTSSSILTTSSTASSSSTSIELETSSSAP